MSAERIPPQNLEAEQSLLGALLIDRDAMLRVGDVIRAEDFYRQAHADIFTAMIELFEKKEPIDLLSLGNRLSEKGRLEAIGGRAYMIELTSMVPTSAHALHYAQIIQKKATLRRLLSAAAEVTARAFDENEEVSDVLDMAEQKIFSVSQSHIQKNFTPISEALGNAWERIDELQHEKGKLRGVCSN